MKVPENAQHYDDKDMTPKKFFEWAKNEDRFFMDPSWCIAKNKGFFDGYDLSVRKEETPRCYVIISKLYPNLRFCIRTDEKPLYKRNFIEGDNIMVKTISIEEIRDPWQIGGIYHPYDFGLEVMELAFGKDKIEKLIRDKEEIKKICKVDELENTENIKFSRNLDIKVINSNFANLIDGTRMFEMCSSLREFNGKLPKLKIANYMFNKTSVETFDVDLIQLEKGECMFMDCKKLKSFNSEIPSLENGDSMFLGSGLTSFETDMPKLKMGRDMFCDNEDLERFNSKVPNLTLAIRMFENCKNLTRFESDLPSLMNGDHMFCGCNLEEFSCDTRELQDGRDMFNGCKQLRKFRGNLSSLVDGGDMFRHCKLDTESVKNIAETISKAKDDFCYITIGVDEMDEEKERYIKMIEEKGWKVIVE